MTDMLVKLYNLPDSMPAYSDLLPAGVRVRKPLGSEKILVVGWVREHFGEIWASEADITFSRLPASCYIAQREEKLIGFACYDAGSLGFFGPTGVLKAFQGQGIGKALLLACMYEMKLKGYGYAIIGGVGPEQFYEKVVGAIVIPGSTPGVWKDFLYGEDDEEHP